jgi:motility quorum-sensing regulator/GCU-specific mRNA interferase toxin
MTFGYDDILEANLDLSPTDFSKRMTTHADHRIWQDVYSPMTRAGRAYLKLTVIDDLHVVSFKDLDP